MDAFQREQDRIAAETQALSARIEPEPNLDLAPKVVERAFAIIENIAEAYLRANDRERSMWNEAVFAGYGSATARSNERTTATCSRSFFGTQVRIG